MVKKALLGNVGDAEIRLLKIFKTVVECGGLSAAELELNIGRSTVSRHVKDLEERLGLVLCRRGRAGFALTSDGQRVYDCSLRLLQAMAAFRADVHGMHADLIGNLSIGLFDKTATNPDAQIGRAVRDFRRTAPLVALDVTVGTLSDVESGVIDGRMHVGVVPDHRRSESLDYHPLFAENMYLYCGRQHPLYGARQCVPTWDELHDYDYAGLAFHSPNMEASRRLGFHCRAAVTDQEAIATLILSGCYIGFLPDHYAANFVREALIQRIEHPECVYVVDFMAILRRSPVPARAALTFLEALKLAHAANPTPA